MLICVFVTLLNNRVFQIPHVHCEVASELRSQNFSHTNTARTAQPIDTSRIPIDSACEYKNIVYVQKHPSCFGEQSWELILLKYPHRVTFLQSIRQLIYLGWRASDYIYYILDFCCFRVMIVHNTSLKPSLQCTDTR
jgi:hypothetical protein